MGQHRRYELIFLAEATLRAYVGAHVPLSRAAVRSGPAATAQGALPASVKQNASKSQAAAKLRAASEAAVTAGRAADHDLLAAFTAYLKLEEAGGDAARLQVAAPPHRIGALACPQALAGRLAARIMISIF